MPPLPKHRYHAKTQSLLERFQASSQRHPPTKPCIACSGTGRASNGEVCYPCCGTGVEDERNRRDREVRDR